MKVCRITCPPRSDRPARPATWVNNWNPRSRANGSGRFKSGIRQHDADQRDQRQVQPLGEHLRAHQHIGVVRCEMGQDEFVGILLAGRFPIPAQDLGFWKKRFDLLLHLFAAQPVLADLVAAAHGAFLRHLARVPAAVAKQVHARELGMDRSTASRTRAFDRRPARAAKDISRRAASIQIKNRLFTAFQRAGQCLDQVHC